MTFIRVGECNMCGECCGYPRSTDGGQNNPWPPDWPESIQNWSPESIKEYAPIIQLNRGVWVKGKGLCKSDTDFRCPLLSDKVNGEAKCSVVGTDNEYIWKYSCQPVPPLSYETLVQVKEWYKNCPSCSYEYIEE